MAEAGQTIRRSRWVTVTVALLVVGGVGLLAIRVFTTWWRADLREARADLDQAEARWELAGPESYSVQYLVGGFGVVSCEVQVSDHAVISATGVEPVLRSCDEHRDAYTMEGLFDLVHSELDGRPDQVTQLEFDPDTVQLLHAAIVTDSRAADAVWGITVEPIVPGVSDGNGAVQLGGG